MAQQTAPLRVDIASDVVCPWCAIGYHQLAKASRETGIAIDVHWHPFELNPNMPAEGENLRAHLAAKYGTTPEDSRSARARITEIGAALGFRFEYAEDMRMFNTFRAHQLIDWAGGYGKAHEAKLALLEAYFRRRENISDPEVLAEVAAGVGLDRADALAMLASGERAAAVRELARRWRERGVRGVPTMLFGGKHLVTGALGEAAYACILHDITAARAA